MRDCNLFCACGFRLFTVILAVAAVGPGCAHRVLRASKLPPEMMAPAALDTETIDLSGLVDQSVSAEVIQPGDVLEAAMITDYTKLTVSTTPLRVADDGTIVVPLVGKMSVAGLEVERAEQAINAESIARGVFRTPCITLTMRQCRTRRVTVVGAVNKPGPHELPRGSTSLMAALLAADGLSKEAGTEVEIRHTDSRGSVPGTTEPPVVKVDLVVATSGAAPLPGLRDGDVVQVIKRKLPPIYVIGLVMKPGSFPYPPSQEIRVLDALAMAGGVSNAVAENVLLIRHLPGAQEPVRIAVSIHDAKNGQDNLALAPGDTVSVERTAATSAVDVVQTFFRVALGGTIPWF
jgi:polysaccharide biosynthesis/export protein